MSTTTLSAQQLQVTGVLNVDTPPRSWAIISFQADFTPIGDTQYILDLTTQVQGDKFNQAKTLFFDNSSNPDYISVVVTNTQQAFTIPPRSNGFYPLAAQPNSQIILHCASGGATQIGRGQLYNYHIEPQVWYQNGSPVIVTGTVPVSVADGADVALGSKADAAVTNPGLSASAIAVLKGILKKQTYGEYETVAASTGPQTLGGAGAVGDFLDSVIIIPATTSPGSVVLNDGATAITIFTGGALSVSNLVPFIVPIRAVSQNGAWQLTNGANVSSIGVGDFT